MGGLARNLELKAVDPAPQRTLAACFELGAEDHGTLHQRDTYFHSVQGRLKLREAPPAPAELIAYARADRAGPKVSSYRVVPVFDPEDLTAALSEALGVRAVVEKARRLLVWRDVRIHLDRVEGLGHFLELEAIATAPGGPAAREPVLTELRTALGIGDERLVEGSYVDLLADAA